MTDMGLGLAVAGLGGVTSIPTPTPKPPTVSNEWFVDLHTRVFCEIVKNFGEQGCLTHPAHTSV